MPAADGGGAALDHVGIRTRSLDDAVRWYVEMFGCRVVNRWTFDRMHLAFLELPGGGIIEVLGEDDPDEPQRPGDLGASLAVAGHHHFCLMVKDLAGYVRRLEAKGVKVVLPVVPVEAIRRRIAYVTDMDGNMIELSEVTEA